MKSKHALRVTAAVALFSGTSSMAQAQTISPPRVPLSDVDCLSTGSINTFYTNNPRCVVNGTRTITTLSETRNATTLTGAYQVVFDGTLAIDGSPTILAGGITLLPDANQYFDPNQTVSLTSQYVGSFTNFPRSLLPASGNPNDFAYFSSYSNFQNTVRAINVNIANGSALDSATNQNYIFSIASIDPTNIRNGDRTALAGVYQSNSDSGAIVFGKLSGDAVLASGRGVTLNPVYTKNGYVSPYNLQYQVTARETTRLDESGLTTPTISVSDGINMNGSRVSNVGDGVAAGDAVNKAQLDGEAAVRSAADAALSGQIASETSARQAADAGLSTRIDTEAGTRAAADAALASQIGSEVTARQVANVTLGNQIGSEAATRASADLQLSQRIDTEAGARQALGTALVSETSARMAADLQLSSRVDAISGRLDQIDSRLDRMEARVSSGTAVAVAMGGAAFLPDMKFNLTANVATYGGAHAGAVQFGALVSPHVAVNAGVATGFNKGGRTAGRAGITFGW